MCPSLKILMLEDNLADAELITRILQKQGRVYDTKLTMTKDAFLEQLINFNPDIILADNSLPKFNAIDALKLVNGLPTRIPFIMVSGTVSDEYAVDIMKLGADDYVLKDRLVRLPSAIDAAIDKNRAERQKLETHGRLTQSEEKYRTLVEQAFDGIIIYLPDGRIIDANASACMNTGYSIAELKNLLITDLLISEDLETKPINFDLLRSGVPVFDQRNVKRKDGTCRQLEIVTRMLPDGSLMALGRDITEKMKSRAQEALFASIVNSSEDAIISKTLSGIITTWNRAAETLFGYTADEAIGQSFNMLAPADSVDELPAIINQISNGNYVRQYETERKRKNGTSVFVSLTVSPVKNNKGIVEGVSIIAHDITRRKLAERKIIESEQNLKAILDNTNDGFILLDTTGKIRAINQLTKESIFVTRGEEMEPGMNLIDHIEPSRVNAFREIFNKALTGTRINYDRCFDRGNGRVTWINFSINPVYRQGLVEGICITGRDITEKKLAEQEKEFDTNNMFALINNTKDLLWSVDRDLNLIAFNQAFEDIVLLGSGKKICKGQPVFYKGLPKNVEARFRQYYQRALAGEAFVETYFNVSPVEYTTEISFNPIYEGDHVIGTACFARDITDRQKAENIIRISNERYEAVSKATSDAIWDHDFTTGKTYMSGTGYKFLFGHNIVDDYASHLFWENHIHPDDREVTINALQTAFDNPDQKQVAIEYRFLKANGKYAYVNDRCFIIREKGIPVRALGAMQDITGKKEAEKLLKKNLEEKRVLAERMSIILNTLPATIALLDERGKIIETNDAWKRAEGQSCFVGSKFGVGDDYVLIAENSFGYNEEYGKALAGGIKEILYGRSPEFVYEYPCHSGHQEKWFRMVVSPLTHKDQGGAVVMHIDITELRRLEEERLKSKTEEQKKITRAMLQGQEKERNQIGRELHDNISQLLAAIKMKLSFCLKNPLHENSISILNQTLDHTQEALTETRNLSHQMVMPRFAENSFQQALEELIANYNNDHRSAKLDSIRLSEQVVPALIKESLYRIVQEQLNNIEKYAQATEVRVQVCSYGNSIAMVVDDNGVGFDTKKRKSGIGLTNIRNRAESYNGSATIFSEPGKGCKLIVEIPLRDNCPLD